MALPGRRAPAVPRACWPGLNAAARAGPMRGGRMAGFGGSNAHRECFLEHEATSKTPRSTIPMSILLLIKSILLFAKDMEKKSLRLWSERTAAIGLIS